MTAGLVYYVLDANRREQFLKIGHTKNLKQRIVDLRGISTSGQCPTVLALEDGGFPLERERHEQFATLRSHGEWFRYAPPLADHVAALEHPMSYLLDRPYLWQWTGGWGPLGPTAGGQKPFDPPVQPGEDEQYARLPPVDF